jgi:hypothetical protein
MTFDEFDLGARVGARCERADLGVSNTALHLGPQLS